jgi:glycerophosphoryl diester phosphodiesterase
MFQDLSPKELAEAKTLGLKVVPWTVNERPQMERLIRAGVDGLITDYPDRLRAVMTALGMLLPPQVTARDDDVQPGTDGAPAR